MFVDKVWECNWNGSATQKQLSAKEIYQENIVFLHISDS